jgi:predicted DNA-binding antitoxin AbrB/MazE fold protein
MRVVEAQYEKGFLRPSTPLALRQGERVHLIVLRKPDPIRWDFARFARSSSAEDVALAEAGLEDWAATLDHQEHQ